MPAMSDSPSYTPLSTVQQQQAQRIRSFRTLLDPTDLLPGHNVADLYSIRHLCLQGGGIPDTAISSAHGWLRAQAWRVLLGYLSPEKSEWNHTLDKRRAEYYQFARDFLPEHVSTSTLTSNSTPTSQRSVSGSSSEKDALLDQIYRDLSRSKKNAFAFYREEVKPSRSCPLAPAPLDSRGAEERIAARHSLLERLERINKDFAFAMREERRSRNTSQNSPGNTLETPRKVKETHLSVSQTGGPAAPHDQSPSITVQPASPSNGVSTPVSLGSDDDSCFASADEGDNSTYSELPITKAYTDRRWHSLLRILYIYALLNPSMGYVQGMNEVLFVLLYVMGTSGPLPSRIMPHEMQYRVDPGNDSASDHQRVSSEEVLLAGTEATTSFRFLDSDEDFPASHAEADAFWCFSALVGDMRDLYDFEGMENAGLQIVNKRVAEGGRQQVGGMAATLKQFSLRLKWIDLELWKQMCRHSLDPRLPYYSFRWLACLISTELTLPSVLRVWDAILSEAAGSSRASSFETSSKIDLLIDVCCSLLVNIRGPLLSALKENDTESDDDLDAFGRAMMLLQHYPDDDVEPIVEMACLYRQRRLAAPLTGDGPSTNDEDEDILKTMKERTASALRRWNNGKMSNGTLNSTTPARKQTWLNSSPRTPSTFPDEVDDDTSTPSRSSSAALLKRYTEAVQSSDAAASLSKASTNLTAKAMASWSAGRVRSVSSSRNQISSPSIRQASFADFKNSFVNRVRSATSGSTTEEDLPKHPSLRWSLQGDPPYLPIPNVNDNSFDQKDPALASSATRSHASLNRLGAINAAMQSGDTPLSPESSQNNSTPGTSPILGSSKGKFASPQTTPRGTTRGAGPKPLLLTGSAKPPRERSPTESTTGDDLASRKVSSGPLANNASSPLQLATGRRRRRNGSRHGNDSASATSSNAGGESTGNETAEEEVTEVKTDTSALPLLPSLQAVKTTSPSLGSLNAAMPMGLQGSGAGTVPASAFARVKAVSSGIATDSESQSDRPRPNFGQVASSANVPLATKTTLQRKPQRTNSDQTVSTYSGEMKSPYRDSLGSVSNYSGSAVNENRNSLSSPPTTSTEEEMIKTLDNEPQRYTLTDEPVIASPTGQISGSHFIQRNGSTSSNRSSVGLVRSKRAYSGGKKTSNRRSIGHLSSAESDSQKETGSANESLKSRGGSESIRLGTIETGSFGIDFETQRKTTSPPNVLPAELPSPHADHEKLVPAEELLQRLQLDNGFSGGESSGFEDEYVPLPSRYSKTNKQAPLKGSYRYL